VTSIRTPLSSHGSAPSWTSVRAALENAHASLRSGKLDEAKRAFQDVIAIHPEQRTAWSGLARAQHALGDFRAAVAALQSLLALEPRSWQTLSDLGSAWTEMREWERAEQAFAEAEALCPDEPLVQVNRATLELQRGSPEQAIARLESTVARHADYGPAHARLGLALRDAGRAADAVAPLRRALVLSPTSASYACALGRALLESGAAEQALATARDYLQRQPGHSGARALESLARLSLGDESGASRLLDYARLVTTTTLSAPPGFADLAAFNAALADHVARHPSLLESPVSHATAQGLHSGSLLVEPRGPIRGLETAVGTAASDYLRDLSERFSEHHVVKHRPRAAFLRMWCVVLERGGHQIPHIHPEAWISGVYYPKLPEPIRKGTGPAGWLEFGEPDAPFPSQLTPARFLVRPEEGRMVLFPSHLYHRTLPFDEPGTRISIAFDVVPVPGSH
jgi:Flp pilus assembly protein TadD